MIRQFMKKIFRKKNPYERRCYAITQGSYKGDFFVYINHDEENFYFLSLPYNNAITVPAETFTNGIKHKIVDLIEKIPNNVYEICLAQYNEAKAKDNINRLKQPAPSRSVDSRERQD